MAFVGTKGDEVLMHLLGEGECGKGMCANDEHTMCVIGDGRYARVSVMSVHKGSRSEGKQ